MSSSSSASRRKAKSGKVSMPQVQSVVDKAIAQLPRPSKNNNKKKKNKNKNKNKNKKQAGVFTTSVDTRDYATIIHLNDSWGELTVPNITTGLHCLAIGNINPALPYATPGTNFLNLDFSAAPNAMANSFQSGFLTRSVAQANPFDAWSADDIVISYNHRAGEFSDAGKAGEIIIAYQPNSNEGLPTSTVDLDNMRWRVSCLPCKDMALRLPASLFKRRKYTRSGVIPATAVIDDYDTGRILVFAYGLSSDSFGQMLGEIKITGTVKVYEATMASQQTSQQTPAPRNVLGFGVTSANLNDTGTGEPLIISPLINTNMIGATYADGEPLKIQSVTNDYIRMPPGYFKVGMSAFNQLTTTAAGDVTAYLQFDCSLAAGVFTCSGRLANVGAVSQSVDSVKTAEHIFYAPVAWTFRVFMNKTITGAASVNFGNAFGGGNYGAVITVEAM